MATGHRKPWWEREMSRPPYWWEKEWWDKEGIQTALFNAGFMLVLLASSTS